MELLLRQAIMFGASKQVKINQQMYKNNMKNTIYLKDCLGIDKPSRAYYLMGTPAINPNPSGAGQAVSGTVTANQGTANATPWNENIAQFGGTNVTLGQKAMASSMPVVLASDQASIPVSGTVTANAGTNLNTSALATSANLTTLFGTAAAMADGVANPTLGGSQSYLMAFNGTTWDRLHDLFMTADGNAVQTGLYTLNQNLMYNGTNWDRVRGDTTNGLFVNVKAQAALPTGSNVIGALTANQSVNMSQINAVTPLMGNGTTGTGSLRVTIASDNTAFAVNATLSAETTKVIGTVNQGTSPWIVAGGGTAGTAATGVVTVQGIAGMTKLLVTPDSVALPANQSVNVAQINGVTPLMGNGTTGTGSQRVTLASDSTGIANYGHGATGAAVPSGATYKGGLAKTALPTAASDGNLTGAMVDKFGRQIIIPQGMRDIVLPMTQLTLTSTTTETSLIAAVASTFNDLLSVVIVNTSATGTQVDFRDSTGGTVRLTVYVPPTDMRGIAYQVPLPQNAVNTAWTAKCGSSVASIIITGSYIANK